VEAIKRLSIFNERTKYKFHTEISDVVNNITKENGLTLVNKSGGYTFNRKDNTMIRDLINYMKDISDIKKTKRGFLDYIGSQYTRGQFATFWSAANKQGIIEKVGGGSNVTYKLGPNYDDWEKGKVVSF
jgi:cation diffusion facilitator CzcD-associated flavoprotein CzcO